MLGIAPALAASARATGSEVNDESRVVATALGISPSVEGGGEREDSVKAEGNGGVLETGTPGIGCGSAELVVASGDLGVAGIRLGVEEGSSSIALLFRGESPGVSGARLFCALRKGA